MVINLAMGAGFVGHTRNVIAWLGGSYPLRARRVVLNGCTRPISLQGKSCNADVAGEAQSIKPRGLFLLRYYRLIYSFPPIRDR